MRYLTWSLRAVLFLLLLGLAVKNDQPVVLNYFFGFEWHTSLILLLLCFFALGVAVGLLAISGSLLRQRRVLSALKKDRQTAQRQGAYPESSTFPSTISEKQH